MLAVTNPALELLDSILESTSTAEEQRLRLVHRGEGELGLALDVERDGDQVVTREERPLLLIEPALSTALDSSTLDAEQDAAEADARLTLRQPPDLVPGQ